MTSFGGLFQFLKIFKYIGLYPLTRNTDQRILKCRKVDILIVVTSVVAFEALGIISMLYIFKHASEFLWIEYDVTGNIFELIEIGLAGSAYMVILLWILYRSSDNFELIDEICNLERQMVSMSNSRLKDYTAKLYYFYIFFNGMFTTTVVLSYQPGENFQYASIYAIAVYLLKGVIVSAILSIYSCLASIIYIYVQIINEKIKTFNFRDLKADAVEFNKLLVLHSQLSDICDNLNNIYGIPILIGSAYVFFSLVHEWFFIYWLIIYYHNEQSVTIWETTLNILWVLPDMTFSLICFLCFETNKKVSQFMILVRNSRKYLFLGQWDDTNNF